MQWHRSLFRTSDVWTRHVIFDAANRSHRPCTLRKTITYADTLNCTPWGWGNFLNHCPAEKVPNFGAQLTVFSVVIFQYFCQYKLVAVVFAYTSIYSLLRDVNENYFSYIKNKSSPTNHGRLFKKNKFKIPTQFQ